MGHSIGGTVLQLLLDRGLGRAGVGIAPGTVKGVPGPAALHHARRAFPVLGNPFNRNKATGLSAKQFHYAFCNTMSRAESDKVYERYHIPAANHALFDVGLATFTPNGPTKVDFTRDDRAPMLSIAFEDDHIVPPKASPAQRREVQVEGAHRLQGVPRAPALPRRARLGGSCRLRARVGHEPDGHPAPAGSARGRVGPCDSGTSFVRQLGRAGGCWPIAVHGLGAWPSSTAPSSTWRCRTIGRDLDASTSELQWMLNGYLLTLASLILLGGSLGDRHRAAADLRRSASAWFTAASLLCAIAPSAEVLIFARLLQGVGGALLTPGSLAMIEASFRPRRPCARDRRMVGPGRRRAPRSGRCSAATWSTRSRGGRSS